MTVYKIKRIYESPESDDGYRVLVDRLWPRGISKNERRLTNGQKILRRLTSCANGSVMIQKNLQSSRRAIPKSWMLIL